MKDDTLACIEQLAERLNSRATLANATIQEWNEILTSSGAGVRASIDASPTVAFGYERINGRWCLAAQITTLPPSDIQPLLDCSREARIACVTRIPDLLREIRRVVAVKCDEAGVDTTIVYAADAAPHAGKE